MESNLISQKADLISKKADLISKKADLISKKGLKPDLISKKGLKPDLKPKRIKLLISETQLRNAILQLSETSETILINFRINMDDLEKIYDFFDIPRDFIIGRFLLTIDDLKDRYKDKFDIFEQYLVVWPQNERHRDINIFMPKDRFVIDLELFKKNGFDVYRRWQWLRGEKDNSENIFKYFEFDLDILKDQLLEILDDVINQEHNNYYLYSKNNI